MDEKLTLALVSVELVKEGIKFLYGEAAEALNRWRAVKGQTPQPTTETAQGTVPEIFATPLTSREIHFEAVAELEAELKKKMQALSNYANETEDVSLENAELLNDLDGLREMMEAIYAERLTFRGEERPGVGPVVNARAEARRVVGRLTGIEAESLPPGTYNAHLKIDEVAEGGDAAAVRIGGNPASR